MIQTTDLPTDTTLLYTARAKHAADELAVWASSLGWSMDTAFDFLAASLIQAGVLPETNPHNPADDAFLRATGTLG